jgi:hypothetical protein
MGEKRTMTTELHKFCQWRMARRKATARVKEEGDEDEQWKWIKNNSI